MDNNSDMPDEILEEKLEQAKERKNPFVYPHRVDFESWLMDKFSYSVTNTENDPGKDVDLFDEMYYDWVVALPIENVIEYANDYAKELLKKAGVK